jgi:hypothetical protein
VDLAAPIEQDDVWLNISKGTFLRGVTDAGTSTHTALQPGAGQEALVGRIYAQ